MKKVLINKIKQIRQHQNFRAVGGGGGFERLGTWI